MDSTPTPTADESPSVSLAYIKNDKICYTIDALLSMRPKEKPKRPKGMKKLQVIFPDEPQRKAYVPHSYYQASLAEDTWLMPDDNFSYDFESSTIDEIEKERLEYRETWDHTDEIPPPAAEPEKLKNISNQIKELIGVSPSIPNNNNNNNNSTSQPPSSPLSFETFHATVIGKQTNINDLFRNANESNNNNNNNNSSSQNQSNSTQPLRNTDPSIITTSDSSYLAFNDPSIMRIPIQSPIVQSPTESNSSPSPLPPSIQQQQQQQPLPSPNIQNQLSQSPPSQIPFNNNIQQQQQQQQHIMYQYQISHQPPPPSQQQQQQQPSPNGSYPILYQMPRTFVTFKQQSPSNNNNNQGGMQQNQRMGNQQPLAPIQALKARKIPVVLSASGPEGRYALPIHQQQQPPPQQQQQMQMPMYVDMGQRVYMRQIDPQQQQYQYYLQQQQQQQQQMQYYQQQQAAQQQQQQNQQHQQSPPSTQ